MIAVDLIRRRILRSLEEIRIYISCLQDRENEALERLHGLSGIELRARVCDYILAELGHEVTTPAQSRFSQSHRAANASASVTLTVEPAKRRGRPPKPKTDEQANGSPP